MFAHDHDHNTNLTAFDFPLQKLEAESEEAYLDSDWADNAALKRNFHGLNNIKWGPK